ncbi:hypothetical protein B23_0582 [Geobacillus thermoleovorans B23]|nr:hypothetical protein B23_0582 [Geobacillus thermoleovorans B23]
MYTKKDKYEDYLYLLEYKDRLGNVYYYSIDETEEGYYIAPNHLQRETAPKHL